MNYSPDISEEWEKEEDTGQDISSAHNTRHLKTYRTKKIFKRWSWISKSIGSISHPCCENGIPQDVCLQESSSMVHVGRL